MEKPPFEVTPQILNLASEIQEILGELKAYSSVKTPLKLRKENKIKTVHHSLAIEGNSITEEQITALLEGKRVLGSAKEIKEVNNALRLYEDLHSFNADNEKDLLKAHKILMEGLLEKPGRYRNSAVGILKNGKVSKMAPPEKQVPHLMGNLFHFLKAEKNISYLLKACIFHYELEFIHPFSDGNGRMGRLWQQILLMKHSPVFEFLSVESLIHKKQKSYYKALKESDIAGSSTRFIEFSLEIILQSLLDYREKMVFTKTKKEDRIEVATDHFGDKPFSRKEYLNLHKGISTASASRDLALAVKMGILSMFGEKAMAVYKKKRGIK